MTGSWRSRRAVLVHRAASRLVLWARCRSQAVMEVAPSFAPHLGPIVLTDGGNEFGVEPVCEPERLGQYIIVDGQVETIDGVSQRLNDGADLRGHTASVLVFA